MKKIISSLFALLFAASAAQAGEVSVPMTVTFDVEAGCSANWSGDNIVHFGDITSHTMASNLSTVTKSLSIICSTGLPYQIKNTTQSVFTGAAKVVMLDYNNNDADIAVTPINMVGEGLNYQSPVITVKMVALDGSEFEPTDKPFINAPAGALATAAPSVITITW